MIVMMKTKMISSKTMAKQTTLMMKMTMMTTTTTMKMMFLKVAFQMGALKTNKIKKRTMTEMNTNIPTLDYLLKNFCMKMSYFVAEETIW